MGITFKLFIVALIIAYCIGSFLWITKKTKYTYYINFSSYQASRTVHSWVIRETMNNMDKPNGLLKTINTIEKERGYKIILQNWKLLGTQWIPYIFENKKAGGQ